MSKSGDWALREEEKSIQRFENEGEYQNMINEKRKEAENSVKNHFNEILKRRLESTSVPYHKLLDVAFDDEEFHHTIWNASTVILPGLEVQVVIDGNNKCFVSTGTPGFVDFFEPPVGMSLPIRCWIHTHPFGSAYFSGTDIRTVSIWEPYMESAYVLGGEQHYGRWDKVNPQQLLIYEDNELIRQQTWEKKEEEE